MPILLIATAMLIATLIPAVALFLMYKLDFYQTGEFKIMILCVVAGLVAYACAAQVNGLVFKQGWLSVDNIKRYSAPVAEEILKGLILWYLVRRAKFSYFVEGAIYGFAIGIGFAVVENYEYILKNPNAGLITAVTRVLSTNLMHATTCSILGLVLGLARFERGLPLQLGISLGGLAAAILIHVGFNTLVNLNQPVIFLLIYAIASGLGGAGLIAWLIKRGLNTSRGWIDKSLGMDDRVTRREVEVVTRMETIDDILEPLAAQFGEKKAQQIKDFLVKQARMGIMRKSLEKLSSEREKQAKEQEIAKLRADMDEARRLVGSYAMLYLRNVFPENDSPLWGKLETALQERMAAPRPAGGPNLWANLKSRQDEQKKLAETNTEPKQEHEE